MRRLGWTAAVVSNVIPTDKRRNLAKTVERVGATRDSSGPAAALANLFMHTLEQSLPKCLGHLQCGLRRNGRIAFLRSEDEHAVKGGPQHLLLLVLLDHSVSLWRARFRLAAVTLVFVDQIAKPIRLRHAELHLPQRVRHMCRWRRSI